MCDQSSLDEDVVQDDVDDDVMAGTNLSGNILAAVDGVLGIEREPSISAPASRLRRLLGNELLPLHNAEEVFQNIPYDLHCLGLQLIVRQVFLKRRVSIVL